MIPDGAHWLPSWPRRIYSEYRPCTGESLVFRAMEGVVHAGLPPPGSIHGLVVLRLEPWESLGGKLWDFLGGNLGDPWGGGTPGKGSCVGRSAPGHAGQHRAGVQVRGRQAVQAPHRARLGPKGGVPRGSPHAPTNKATTTQVCGQSTHVTAAHTPTHFARSHPSHADTPTPSPPPSRILRHTGRPE